MTMRVSHLLVLAAAAATTAVADVFVTDKSFESTISEYRSMAATFGKSFPENGVSGRAVMVTPDPTGCRAIDPPPPSGAMDFADGDDADDSYLNILEEFQVFNNVYLATPDGGRGGGDHDDKDPALTRWIAMIARYGGCNFEHKVMSPSFRHYPQSSRK